MALDIDWLGSVAYRDALKLQEEAVEARRAGGRDRLLLLEHAPVVTLGRSARAENLRVSRAELSRRGVDLLEVSRGGDVTYHGPGQLVVYPILDLNTLGLRLLGYMRFLERIVTHALAVWGIEGRRDETATGVWVDGSKICAMGVRLSRWVSMHGLALNVTTDLSHFDLIVPCGLTGRTVTSMQHEIGDACPPIAEVKDVVVRGFEQAIASATALPAPAPPSPRR